MFNFEQVLCQILSIFFFQTIVYGSVCMYGEKNKQTNKHLITELFTAHILTLTSRKITGVTKNVNSGSTARRTWKR